MSSVHTLQAPVVTVMVRSMQRASLPQALASIAAQTAPCIEVLVINARGGHHPPLPERCGAHALRLGNQDGEALDRPAAANQALDLARGHWLLFLDDDDEIDPEHLSRLLDALAATPEAVAAYTGVRLLAADGAVVGTLDEPFQPDRLWLANFLPIHAVLFSSKAVRTAGLRFDPDLAVYEDWDFWRQLSLVGRFVHQPGVSATYRLVGNSGLSGQASDEVARRGRESFYRKWLPRLDSEVLNRLMTLAELNRAGMASFDERLSRTQRAFADQLAQAAQERQSLTDELHRSRAEAANEWQRLNSAIQNALAEARARAAEGQAERAARRLDAAAHAEAIAGHEYRQADLDRRLTAALAEYRRLEQGYRNVTSSLSWRVTRPLRRLRGLASAGGLRAAVRALPISPEIKQAAKLWLATRAPGGQRMLRWLAPAAVVQPVTAQPTADTRATTTLDKEAVRQAAEGELTRFLENGERLHLRSADQKPRVSVIVVLYNQAGLSLLCLKALAESVGVAFETLIVDNASSDRMPQLLDRITGAQILPQDDNLGFLRAVNLAAGQASGEHLLLLNNDAVVEPDTLARAVARLALEPTVGAVGGPILLWDGRLQEAGSIIWRDGSCLGYGRGDSPDAPAYRFVRDVDYCSGAFLMIRRALFERLGRFDDAFAPAYYEESDFCVRLWEAGHRIVYDPKVRVKHFEFASDVGSGRAIELQTQHRALFVERHPDFLAERPMPDLASVLPARHRMLPGARRVLVIDDRVPLPWLGQGYPRAASLLAAIVADGHFVTHYPLQFPSERLEDVARALPETVEVMLDMGLTRLAEFMASRRGYYQVVLVSRPHNMEVVRAMRRQDPGAWDGVRIAYDAEALFSLRDIAKAAVLGQPMSAEEQARRIAAEMALAEGAQSIVTVTEAEAAHYRAAGHADVQVLGHAIEPEPPSQPFERRRGFLFVGALLADDTPNSDSLFWFVGQVWPHIVAVLGDDAVLDIVGACEAPGIRALASLNVRIHGTAADLSPWFSASRVFIVPTRFAAGIPHKAHEAAARGLPMVVTRLIATQLGWADRVPVGDDARQFAQACVRLHQDAASWRQASETVLAAVREDCDPAVFARQLHAIIQGDASTGSLTRVIDDNTRSQSRRAVAATQAQAADTPDAEDGRVAAIEPVTDPAPEACSDQPPTAHERRLAELRLLAGQRQAEAAEPALDDGERTADHWGRDARDRQQAVNALRHWSSHPVAARELNRLVSGDVSIGWMQHLKRAHFPRRVQRGLSLGSGSGAVVVDAVRLDIVAQMEGIDISADAVAVANERARQQGVADRASFRTADLNQTRLTGEYDLVMFEQSLHHVDHLDDVLDQCAAVLRPDGRFVINEYVGPDRFQWSDEVQRLMDALLDILPLSHRVDPISGELKSRMIRARPEQVIAVDPSEAIHSSAIMAACEARFELVERRDFGGTLLQFMLADIVANFDPEDERDAALLRLMIMMEMELIRAGAIDSDFVFAVYRKRRDGATA